jgi:hypothetical protein
LETLPKMMLLLSTASLTATRTPPHHTSATPHFAAPKTWSVLTRLLSKSKVPACAHRPNETGLRLPLAALPLCRVLPLASSPAEAAMSTATDSVLLTALMSLRRSTVNIKPASLRTP